MVKRCHYALRVCFIDDDAEARRQWLELARIEAWKVSAVESVFEANSIAADCYVFDISAVSPNLDVQYTYSSIARLMEDHPGAAVILLSAMSRRMVEQVIDDVAQHTGRRPTYGGHGLWTELREPVNQACGLGECDAG